MKTIVLLLFLAGCETTRKPANWRQSSVTGSNGNVVIQYVSPSGRTWSETNAVHTDENGVVEVLY